ncbi:MAG TPA: hypothetical protein ENJ42_00770 [Hellea balneolensis]|uniref:Uncharacterized protein n=1 Tax=Hellea balneolensis TaxID=287478 RepID=A0A7C5QZJ5_9PROT|nr:hypothetical protein [Hellea balneolensis]
MNTFESQTTYYPPVGKTKRVWQICDELTQIAGQMAKRGDVIESYVAEGGNPNTASTQYSSWKKQYLSGGQSSLPANKGAASYYNPAIGKTKRVWQIADELTRKTGRMASRRDVMEVYMNEGGNPGTSSVQYSLWKKDYLSGGPAIKNSGMPGDAGPVRLHIEPNGNIIIPAKLRAAMALPSSGTVTARVVAGELRVKAQTMVLEKIRNLIKERDKGKGSVVDELIHDRRREAEKENGV